MTPIDENRTEIRVEPSVPKPEEVIPTARPAVNRKRRKPVKLFWLYRLLLAMMALGLLAIFTAAAWIRPYAKDGTPETMSTHIQLGLEPCNMVVMTGKPCPACGMTTSFSLLIHGDILASLRANWVGTILALSWLALMIWGFLSAARAKIVASRYIEWAVTFGMSVILALMVIRWLVIFFT